MAVAFRTRIAYAMPAFAMAVVGIPFYVYMPKFYTDVIGVDIAVMGGILLAMRLFDGVIDPFIGGASDRTHSRWGRRRSWMMFGLLPFVASIVASFVPPFGMSPAMAAIWFGGCMFAVSFFWSAVQVPYESLGAELSFDFDERTAILALRDGLLVLGTVAAVVAPLVVTQVYGLGSDGDSEREKYRLVAMLYAPAVLLACIWCIAAVREHSRTQVATPTQNPWRAAAALFGNRPFVLLLASYAVTAIGSNLPATLITYYVQYVIGDPNVEGFLLLYFVTGVVLLPFWVWVSRRIGKKQSWILSGLINAVAFAGVFFLGRGDSMGYAVLVVISGIGYGASLALPSAMQADVIDYEELRSGVRREGEIIGLWSVARKIAAAVGVGLALPVLGWVGYVPNVEQTPLVVNTLKALYALAPAVLTVAGLLIAWNYPIGKREHKAILDAIEVRRNGGSAIDPLTGKPA